jgi:hypothetical protein
MCNPQLERLETRRLPSGAGFSLCSPISQPSAVVSPSVWVADRTFITQGGDSSARGGQGNFVQGSTVTSPSTRGAPSYLDGRESGPQITCQAAPESASVCRSETAGIGWTRGGADSSGIGPGSPRNPETTSSNPGVIAPRSLQASASTLGPNSDVMEALPATSSPWSGRQSSLPHENSVAPSLGALVQGLSTLQAQRPSWLPSLASTHLMINRVGGQPETGDIPSPEESAVVTVLPPFELSDLRLTIRRFLERLEGISQRPVSDRDGTGLGLWIISLAVVAVSWVLARRQLGQRSGLPAAQHTPRPDSWHIGISRTRS